MHRHNHPFPTKLFKRYAERITFRFRFPVSPLLVSPVSVSAVEMRLSANENPGFDFPSTDSILLFLKIGFLAHLSGRLP